MARHKLMLDTNILIDHLRGRQEASEFLENKNGRLLISGITVAELYAGVRNGHERQILAEFVDCFQVVPLTLDISVRGGLFRRDYRKDGVGLADALIAASVVAEKATLVTRNEKHFPMLTRVLVPYRI